MGCCCDGVSDLRNALIRLLVTLSSFTEVRSEVSCRDGELKERKERICESDVKRAEVQPYNADRTKIERALIGRRKLASSVGHSTATMST
jgi:hypothetical protein